MPRYRSYVLRLLIVWHPRLPVVPQGPYHTHSQKTGIDTRRRITIIFLFPLVGAGKATGRVKREVAGVYFVTMNMTQIFTMKISRNKTYNIFKMFV